MTAKKTAKSKKKSGSGFAKKVLWAFLALILLGVGSAAWYAYKGIYYNNVHLGEKNYRFFFVHTGDSFDDVLMNLKQDGILRDESSFKWLAMQKGYPDKIRPGRYRITKGMSNNHLVNMLRGGLQEPVRLVISNARTLPELVGRIGAQLECDSLALMNLLQDEVFLKPFGLNRKNALAFFIPDSYDFYWNTTAKDFLSRIGSYYEKFWNAERKKSASVLNLSRGEVATLASIVQQESNYKPERPIIAGVYLNRLRKGMRLQADPTVVFAVGDFSIRRVLKEHLSYDSPYNTYLYAGLPPGPIALPARDAIDAVLKADKHNYLYFCAHADFSGKHAFAANLAEHDKNAAKFRKALNNRKIFR
jgi:UPF0755 protein